MAVPLKPKDFLDLQEPGRVRLRSHEHIDMGSFKGGDRYRYLDSVKIAMPAV